MLRDYFQNIAGTKPIRLNRFHPVIVLPRKNKIITTCTSMLKESIFSDTLLALPEQLRDELKHQQYMKNTCFVEEYNGKHIIVIELHYGGKTCLLYSVLQDYISDNVDKIAISSGIWIQTGTLTVEERIVQCHRALP